MVRQFNEPIKKVINLIEKRGKGRLRERERWGEEGKGEKEKLFCIEKTK